MPVKLGSIEAWTPANRAIIADQLGYEDDEVFLRVFTSFIEQMSAGVALPDFLSSIFVNYLRREIIENKRLAKSKQKQTN